MNRLPLEQCLQLIEGDKGQNMRRLFEDGAQQYAHARGSSSNHQAWPGGFWDHTEEVLNLAVAQYELLNTLRPLPFTLSDALLVLAAHDLEKMVRFEADGSENPKLKAKEDKASFRLDLLAQYNIELTPEQANAMKYVEGVRDGEYTPYMRTMGPLASFAHTCDVLSARLWYNYPLAVNDPWVGAARKLAAAHDVVVVDEHYADDGTCLGKVDAE